MKEKGIARGILREMKGERAIVWEIEKDGERNEEKERERVREKDRESERERKIGRERERKRE